MPPKIFVSYRRIDNPDFVERIRDRCVARFKRENVFIDFDSIPPAVKWRERIEQEVIKCDGVIVIIGPKWLDVMREKFTNLEEDFVYFEIDLALRHSKPIFPICIKGAAPPPADKLPSRIRSILDRNISHLDSGRNFPDECERVIDSIQDELDAHGNSRIEQRTRPSRIPQNSQESTVVALRLELPIDRFNADELVELIAGLVQVGVGDISIVNVEEGSVIVTLELPNEAAQKLVQIAANQPEVFTQAGQLKNITYITYEQKTISVQQTEKSKAVGNLVVEARQQMQRRMLDPSSLVGCKYEQFRQHIDKKLDEASTKERNDQLEHNFLAALRQMFENYDYLLVYEGTLKNLKDEREIVLKLSTFHLILYVLEKKISSAQDVQIITEFAGTLVGREFTKTIISKLLEDNIIPEFNGFLHYWCRLDTRAAWGKFKNPRLDVENAKVTLTIENPIISQSDTSPVPESVSRFLEGYIRGIIDEGFRTLAYLWKKTEIFKLPNEPYVVESVNIQKTSHRADVTVNLRTPWLTDATNEMIGYRYGVIQDVTALRKCIEFAIKGLFDLKTDSTFAAFGFLKALKQDKRLKDIDFEAVDRLWMNLNKVVHQPSGFSDTHIAQLERETEYFLAELLFFRISNSILKDIARKNLKEEPSASDAANFEQELNQNLLQPLSETNDPVELEEQASRLRKALNLLDVLAPYEQTQLTMLHVTQPQYREHEEKLQRYTHLKNSIEEQLQTVKEHLNDLTEG